jgi:hypothetical protein
MPNWAIKIVKKIFLTQPFKFRLKKLIIFNGLVKKHFVNAKKSCIIFFNLKKMSRQWLKKLLLMMFLDKKRLLQKNFIFIVL